MGLYDFNILDITEKTKAVWNKGTYLDHRKESGYDINLYALDMFFVEVWYNPATNAIEDIHSFKTLRKLDAYLDNTPPCIQ